MAIYSITGECWCSPDTICGTLPWDLTIALCGLALTGQTICGSNIPIDDVISLPIARKVGAIAKVYKANKSIWDIDLVECDVTLTNPCSNDQASFKCIDNETIEIGDRVHIWIGAPSKFIVFIGDVNLLTRDESGITTVQLESVADILKYVFLKEDITFTDSSRRNAITNILTTYNSGVSYSLNVKPDVIDNEFLGEYWAWDKTVFEILEDIMYDHNIYFINKTLYVTSPDSDTGLDLNYYSGKFQSWSMTKEQGDQFGRCHVDGSDHTIDKYARGTGKKEISHNDMKATTADEVNRIAGILLDEKNYTLYNVRITLPYIFPPRIGKVSVKLPGLEEDLVIKELSWTVSGTDLSTTLSLGNKRVPASQIISKLIEEKDRSHFVY